MELQRKRLFSGFDGTTCKVDPKLMTDGETAVLTWTNLLLTGSDVFYDNYAAISRDSGTTFGEPKALTSLDAEKDGIRTHFTIISTYYSKSWKQWLVFGMRMQYSDESEPICVDGISVGEAVFTRFDPETGDFFGPVREIPLPFPCISACVHGQPLEENGELLLSFYLSTQEQHKATAMTCRYTLENGSLRLVQAGTPLDGRDYSRGFCEPSVAKLGEHYYMTIRTDEVGLWAESTDGLNFSMPQPWQWDDGSVLENYNTMQRWIRFGDRLYLAYTRKDRLNGHVFRHRAPLYLTRFDEACHCLIREEEVILVPELGARLGNFSVCDLSPVEAVLTTAEWMQPLGCEKYGSDNSIWAVTVRR